MTPLKTAAWETNVYMDSKYEGNAMLIFSLVIFAHESNLVFGPHLPVKQRR